MKMYIEKVKAFYDLCFNEKREYGVSNGLAGYLYCLLKIKVNISG